MRRPSQPWYALRAAPPDKEKTMKAFATAASAALLLAVAAALPAQAQQAPQPVAADTMFRATTLNLAAYGEVKAAPDMATITLGVQTQAATASAAMASNADQMGRVVAALKGAGVAAKDIQTSGLNLNAQYAYEDNKPPRLTGYQASNTVTITVHDLARLGTTIDAVVSAGANQVNGISFGLRDPAKAEDEARLAAVKALQAKAQLYANATGHRVSRLVSLSEGVGNVISPPMPMVGFSKRDMAGQGTPVEAGQLTVRVDINGLYELSR
jgi:uncharacterized protein